MTPRHIFEIEEQARISAALAFLKKSKGVSIVFDPDSELHHFFKHASKSKTNVITIDPKLEQSACINPFDNIEKDEGLFEQSRCLANLIKPFSVFLRSGARAQLVHHMLTVIIMHIASARPPVLRNIGELRYILSQSEEDWRFTLKEMIKSKSEQVRQGASALNSPLPLMTTTRLYARSAVDCFGEELYQAHMHRSDELPTEGLIYVKPAVSQSNDSDVWARTVLGSIVFKSLSTTRAEETALNILIIDPAYLGYFPLFPGLPSAPIYEGGRLLSIWRHRDEVANIYGAAIHRLLK